jgi:hypothetical protein
MPNPVASATTTGAALERERHRERERHTRGDPWLSEPHRRLCHMPVALVHADRFVWFYTAPRPAVASFCDAERQQVVGELEEGGATVGEVGEGRATTGGRRSGGRRLVERVRDVCGGQRG